MNTQWRLQIANRQDPAIVELARWVCLAARVEPLLLRRARLRFMPQASAAVEADLWFSPLIQTRGAEFILLYPDVANQLRIELTKQFDAFEKARLLVQETHNYLPELVRLEEDIIYLALAGGSNAERDIDNKLRPVIKAMIDAQRAGLGRWALSALPSLPERANTNAAILLGMVSEAQLYSEWSGLLSATGKALTSEDRALLTRELNRVEVGVRLLGSALELSEPPFEGAQSITVPLTDPRIIELNWQQGEQQRTEKLYWQAGSKVYANDIAPPVSLKTIAGDVYQIISQQSVIEALSEKVKTILLCLLDGEGAPAGTGWMIKDGLMLTGEYSLRRAAQLSTSAPVTKELKVRARFPLMEYASSVAAQVIETIQQQDAADHWTESIVGLRIEDHTTARTSKVYPQSVQDIIGKTCLAFGYPLDRPRGRWVRFRVKEILSDDNYLLIPLPETSSADLKRWSGSPLIEQLSGDVMGSFSLRVTPDASLPILIPAQKLSRAVRIAQESMPGFVPEISDPPQFEPYKHDEQEPIPKFVPKLGNKPKFEPYKHDVYISYAYADDQPLSHNEMGWVSSFSKLLDIRLSQYLGRTAKIRFVRNITRDDFLNELSAEAIEYSATMVSILSPAYVNSDYCLQALETFQRNAHAGEPNVGRSRAIKVEKSPVHLHAQPPSLRGALGHQFYETDRLTRKPIEYSYDSIFRNRYLAKLEDVAIDIKYWLSSKRFAAASAGGQIHYEPTEQTVYLAETTSDLASYRDSLRRELQQYGFVVLPDQKLPLNAFELEKTVRDYLKRSRLSIHLIGANYGIVPEWTNRSVIQIQNDLAAERSSIAQLSRLIWMPRDLQVTEPRQQEFITHLKYDAKAQQGADLLQTSLEDLKTIAHRRLSQAATAASTAAAKASSFSPWIYLMCDRSDRDSVRVITDYFFKKGFEVTLPPIAGDVSEIIQSHKENLLNSEGGMIYYGQANKNWMLMMLNELRKIRHLRPRPFRALSLFIADPVTEYKLNFMTPEVQVIRNFGEFSPDAVETFLNKFERSI